MKIYVSSTFHDLKDYRAAVHKRLRTMRLDAMAMGHDWASGERPLAQCLSDVREADIYVGIFAWRYGFVPRKDNPDLRSSTELEYREARKFGKDRLIFLSNPDAPWDRTQMDAVTGEGESGARIEALREELKSEPLCDVFASPDELAVAVSAAVGARLLVASNKERLQDLGVALPMLTKLAKRHAKIDPEHSEAARRDLERALAVAQEQQAEDAPSSGSPDTVDHILARVRELNAAGKIDEGQSVLDGELEAISDEDDARAEKRLSLLDRCIAQARYRRDPDKAAECELVRLDVEVPRDADARWTAWRALQARWFAAGRDESLGFDLQVAIALARYGGTIATGEDQRGEALDILGVALSTLGERQSDKARLTEAVAAYRAALEDRTRERVPLDWAATQHNLGDALSDLGEQEFDAARLTEAVAAYRGALEVRMRERVPLDWAATLNSLGNALSGLGEQESDGARLTEAVEAYRAALEERTRERVPLHWAATQHNLGNALKTLGEWGSGTALLTEAVAAYRAALEVRTRERVPLDWANTHNNLGIALRTLGDREGGAALFNEAVAAYRAALEEFTHERMPLDWAMTQNNLGYALVALGEREGSTALLTEAVEALRAALLERTRERMPRYWAMTQNNLGIALSALGEQESDTARLTEAVEAYRAALEEYTRERMPLRWAMTQNNLGAVLSTLGERENDTALLTEAVAAHRAALEEYTRERVPLDWAMTQNNLGAVLASLGKRESGTARLTEAVEAYRAALEERTRERVPLDWAATQHNLGSALKTLAEKEGGTARLTEAVKAYRAALEEGTRERVPLDWAWTHLYLALAEWELASEVDDAEARGHFERALSAAEISLDVYSPDGFHKHHEVATELRDAIQADLDRQS